MFISSSVPSAFVIFCFLIAVVWNPLKLLFSTSQRSFVLHVRILSRSVKKTLLVAGSVMLTRYTALTIDCADAVSAEAVSQTIPRTSIDPARKIPIVTTPI